LLTEENSKKLASSLLGEQVNEIGGMAKDAMLEVGNILSASIVGSLANFIGDKIQIFQPNITIDYPLAIIDYAIGEQIKACNMALFTSVDMSIGSEKLQIMQLFFPFFDIVGLIWRKMSDLMGTRSEEFYL
jgi:chemotaxis protein CheY-P-specific phosphatase CheC